MTPLVRGTRHGWASIEVNMLGYSPAGISAISYDDTQEKVNVYGIGIYPVARAHGKYEASAKITLAAYEIDAIQAAVGIGKRLQDIPPFDIVVAFMPTGEDELITHTIRNCEFKTNKRDLKQGETGLEAEFELICSHIDWN